MAVMTAAVQPFTQAGIFIAMDEAVAAAAAVLLAEFLAAGGTARLTVTTGSMTPFLRPGDRVVVQAVPLASLRIGDVLLLMTQPRPLLHRLLTIRGTGPVAVLRTKGDAAQSCDEEIGIERVIGRVAAIERHGRRLQCAPSAESGSSISQLLVMLSLGCMRVQAIRPPLLRRAITRALRCTLACAAAGAWQQSERLPGWQPLGREH